MSSHLQLTANRNNAQQSTGPRTESGKAQSSQNARKHGLTAAHLVIPEEDQEAFESMQSALSSEINPQGELEQTLFDTLLHANWNIRRCRILETQLPPGQLDRHARRHETNFHRALKELRTLQSVRAQNEANPTPSPLVNMRSVHRIHNQDLSRALDRGLERTVRYRSDAPFSNHPLDSAPSDGPIARRDLP